MGGDFRQILLVLPKGSRASIVDACINSSTLWEHCKVLELKQNMRLHSGTSLEERQKLQWFSNWLLDVGEGHLGSSTDGISEITIPQHLPIGESTNPIKAIVDAVQERANQRRKIL